MCENMQKKLPEICEKYAGKYVKNMRKIGKKNREICVKYGGKYARNI